ncbi:MFS transporter [Alkalicoccobacillus murimartini]|uniref:MFS family permease n=1 Tax=Alkalicoccobacillus murimartini TaxID=171685 RepID=A0ABT9YLF3_9BACI|nr:MFS transporter [Alkalicoccobacillus murimartini]MDQ0208705.1 MFS family permease [Alkalicoccobacillus murimartini]
MRTLVTERNFFILLSGVFINGVGGGVYAVSGMLLVLHLSGSVLYSGFAFFGVTLASAMAFLIAPFANYVTYKKGLIVCEILKSALLFSIPLFYLTVGLNVYYVLVLLFAVALLAQFTYPIESTIMPIIVGRDNIVKANSYLHTIREGLDIAFVAGAGILVAVIGPVQAIFITAICHLLSSLSYTFYNFQQPTISKKKESISDLLAVYKIDLKAGIDYMRNSLIPKMIVSIAFINLAMGIMIPNLPAFALIKGGGNEAVYGFYLAAMSFGILIGALVTSKVKEVRFGRLIIISFSITGMLWMGSSLLPVVPSIVFFCLGSISIGIINILIFSAIQQQVETSFVGRVVTVLTSAASIGAPFGALAGGIIGSTLTPVVPVFLCGLAMIIFSVTWLCSTILRKLPKIEEAKLFPDKRIEEAL